MSSGRFSFFGRFSPLSLERGQPGITSTAPLNLLILLTTRESELVAALLAGRDTALLDKFVLQFHMLTAHRTRNLGTLIVHEYLLKPDGTDAHESCTRDLGNHNPPEDVFSRSYDVSEP